jgi:hypothetical protein
MRFFGKTLLMSLISAGSISLDSTVPLKCCCRKMYLLSSVAFVCDEKRTGSHSQVHSFLTFSKHLRFSLGRAQTNILKVSDEATEILYNVRYIQLYSTIGTLYLFQCFF